MRGTQIVNGQEDLRLPWRVRWIPAPHLRHTYIALAAPGGAAAELLAGAPAGMSHLLEHLLYRQNEASGSPLDQLGGKFGLRTEREVMIAFLAFAPQEAATACELIHRWWDSLVVTPEMMSSEVEVVADEIRHTRQRGRSAVREILFRQLVSHGHLVREFVGDPTILRNLGTDDVMRFYRVIRSLGASLVAVGPERPWREDAWTADGPAWRPVTVPLSRRAGQIVIPTAGSDGTIVTAGCLMCGASSALGLGSLAAHSALEYGRLHPGQRRFHTELGLRFLEIESVLMCDVAVLSATASCPASRTKEVAEILETLIRNPADGSSAERLARSTRYKLGRQIENPETWAVDSATRLLFGLEPLESLWHRAHCMDVNAFPELIDASFLGFPSTITFTPA
jgi:hypothetical protein